MKIYLIGSHSSGKSTLARHISQHYKLPLLPEIARIILSEQELMIDSLRSNINETDNYQKQVFERQLLEEEKHSEFVADRSTIDNLAYSGNHSRILPELMKKPELYDYIANLRTSRAIIFFVRPSKNTLKSDGVREEPNWDEIIRIDAQIKLLLEMFDIPHIQINTDSMQERIRLIDSVLALYNR